VAATDSAAGTSSLTGGWLTVAQQNAETGYPANPVYPGPITANHADPGPADPGKSGPPQGTAAPPIPPTGVVPLVDLSGGEAGDTVALLGNSGPIADFDSSAGGAFAPSGAIADTHGYDTGGTDRKEHVPIASNPGWWRRILTGQTFNRQAQVTDNAGWQINSINGRTDLDQYQGQNANAYDPFVIPYSERPIHANFAAEAAPVDPIATAYGIQGSLPDMYGLGGQGDYAYTSPPDPSVTVVPEGAPVPAYEPVVGMEYVSG